MIDSFDPWTTLLLPSAAAGSVAQPLFRPCPFETCPPGLPTSRPDAIEPTGEFVTCLWQERAESATTRPQALRCSSAIAPGGEPCAPRRWRRRPAVGPASPCKATEADDSAPGSRRG